MKLILLYAVLAVTQPPAQLEQLDWLPATTQTVFVVNDLQRAIAIRPPAEQQAASDSFRERFAMRPDEVATLVTGAFVRAELIASDGSVREVVIGKAVAGAEGTLKKLHERLKQQQAKVTARSLGSHEVQVITRRAADGNERVSVSWIHAGHLLLADSLAAANAVLAQIDAADRNGLVVQERFAHLWSQSSPALADDQLAIAWYTDPWLQARRAERRKSPDASADPIDKDYVFAERHGLTGIIGVGGSVVFDEDGGQAVQAFAYAPQPLASSLRIAAHLTGTDDLALPDWISTAVAEAVLLHGDVAQVLQFAGLLFDDGFAEGVEGTYDEVLLDLKDVLELDVQKDLYPLLGPRINMLRGAVEGREREPVVVAFEVQDAARVAELLALLIADDPEATEVVLGDESDRVWHVPGKRGGRDFVLGMLRGVAVYSNDLAFAKAAMRFDESPALLSAEQFAAARELAVTGVTASPSLMIVRNMRAEDQSTVVHPVDLVFHDAGYFAAHEPQAAAESATWLPRRLTMLLAPYGLVVGYREQDGWKFVARTAGTKEKKDVE